MTKIVMTKTEKVIKALNKGSSLTIKQMQTKFGVANPTAMIFNLRNNKGLNIKRIETKNGVSKYLLSANG